MKIILFLRKILYPKCPKCGMKKYISKSKRKPDQWKCVNHGKKYNFYFIKNNKGGGDEKKK